MIAAKLVIGLAVAAIGMFGADNSIGTWKRNIAKSKSSPAVTNPIKSLTIVNAAADGGIKVTVTGERQDGTPIKSSYTVKYDGSTYGAPWDHFHKTGRRHHVHVRSEEDRREVPRDEKRSSPKTARP
jgi:hypothetical protein